MKITEVRKLNYELMQGTENTEYSCICYDTRKVKDNPGCLFICIKGAAFDSHNQIEKIAADGAAGIIIEHEAAFPKGIDVYKVAETREALALCSAAYFGYPADKLTTIAITGTKGKTTTACMVKKILEADGKKCGVIGTLGIIIGDSVTPLLNTTPESYDIHKAFSDMVAAGCEYVVMEASSQAVKQSRVAGIDYDYGIFTNISKDHIGPDEHKDFAEYLMFKTKLFENVKHTIVNKDDDNAQHVIDNCGCGDVKTFGRKDADYTYDSIKYVQNADFIGIEFNAHFYNDKTKTTEIEVGLPGEFNAPNAMAAACVCKQLGVEDEVIATALKDIRVNGRMELVYSTEDLKVIVDFAHNTVSMDSLLHTLREYNPKRLVVVFGCGGNRSPERRYGMGRIAGELADFSIITEDNNRMESIESIMKDIHQEFDKTGGKSIDIPLRADAVAYAIEHHEPGDLVAIIGKGHEDYIDKEGKRTHYTDQEAVKECLKRLSIR